MAAAGLCGLFSGQELWPMTCRSLACLVRPSARRAPLSPRPVCLGWGTGAPLQQARPPIRPGFTSRSLWTQALHPQKALKPTVGDQNVPTPSGIRWGSDGDQMVPAIPLAAAPRGRLSEGSCGLVLTLTPNPALVQMEFLKLPWGPRLHRAGPWGPRLHRSGATGRFAPGLAARPVLRPLPTSRRSSFA